MKNASKKVDTMMTLTETGVDIFNNAVKTGVGVDVALQLAVEGEKDPTSAQHTVALFQETAAKKLKRNKAFNAAMQSTNAANHL